MKANPIDTHLPRSRLNTNVRLKKRSDLKKRKNPFSGALVFHKHNLLRTVANDLKEIGLPLKIGPKCIYIEHQSVSGNPSHLLEIPMLFIMMRNNTPTLFKSYIRHCKVCTSKKYCPFLQALIEGAEIKSCTCI